MYFPACSNLTSNYFNYSSFIRFFVIPNAGNNATVTWFAFIVVLTFYDLKIMLNNYKMRQKNVLINSSKENPKFLGASQYNSRKSSTGFKSKSSLKVKLKLKLKLKKTKIGSDKIYFCAFFYRACKGWFGF